MKILSIMLALAVAILAAVCMVQGRKLADQKSQLTAAREELDQNSDEIEKLQATEKQASTQREALLQQTEELTAQLQAKAAAPARPAPGTPGSEPNPGADSKPDKDAAGFGKVLSKMMQDPEMKKYMRTQQRLVMEQLYGPLVKKLALTPEESDKFKELLGDSMANGAALAGSLFSDGASTNRTQAMESMAASQKVFEAKVKEFLGETRYAEYQSYQQTVGERAQLNQFRQTTGGGENALTDAQTEQLLALMKEEKANAAARGESVTSGNSQDPANLQAMLDDSQTDKLLQTQASLNERVYDRARDVLSSTQLAAFGTYQTNQLQMMRMGMSMAKKMFSQDKDSAEAAK